MTKSVNKKVVHLTLWNGLQLDIHHIPEDKIREMQENIEAKSEERIYLAGGGFFMCKDIAKMVVG